MQRTRFCNVYRELDTVTDWIRDHWREPHADDPYLFFAMAVARFVNWPDTLAELGYPVPWRPDHFVSVLKDRKERGEKVYSNAYTIHAGPGGDKAKYLARDILGPLWANRESLRRIAHGTLAEAHGQLVRCYGIKSFMAAQIIADLKYDSPLKGARDWWTWAAPGPGSERGLNRVLGRRVDAAWTATTWLAALQKLHEEIRPMIAAAMLPRLHAQNLQNCLCEFDKAERVRLGQGKTRQSYPGV